MKILKWLLLFFCVSAQAQEVNYHSFKVNGKAEEIDSKYHRVDTIKYNDLSSNIKKLYTNSAGLFITFKTDAKDIYAKWCVTNSKPRLNLTPIANKGLDIYIKNSVNQWQYAGSKGTLKECDEVKLLTDLDGTLKEFIVYLPLYDEVKSLEIGVDSSNFIEEIDNPFTKKILIYGSSIVHGASASRPGMAYPAILSRKTGYNFINLGISGSAKMEKEVVDMLANFEADMFILDCVPNSSPEQIKERTSYLVKSIRSKHPNVPILMIPSIVREISYFNQQWKNKMHLQNAYWKSEFNALKDEGVSNLYYLDSNTLIGEDHEGTVDGTHPNDLGFMRMVDKILPKVISIL